MITSDLIFEWLELNLKRDYKELDVQKEFAVIQEKGGKQRTIRTDSGKFTDDEFTDKSQKLLDFLADSKSTEEFLLADMSRMRLSYQAQDRIDRKT